MTPEMEQREGPREVGREREGEGERDRVREGEREGEKVTAGEKLTLVHIFTTVYSLE